MSSAGERHAEVVLGIAAPLLGGILGILAPTEECASFEDPVSADVTRTICSESFNFEVGGYVTAIAYGALLAYEWLVKNDTTAAVTFGALAGIAVLIGVLSY